ncbi:cytochrome c [Pontibacter korlensis]|uniref:Cytochrome C n=1 Tax=Pontibacter korlensis TaxID=400092 RepID=A0A0E3UWW9_9BACT|nr:cytochrome c [Pontibacter korlensis]AKD03081.1 cytochrome C [Pontibacter korlensis]
MKKLFILSVWFLLLLTLNNCGTARRGEPLFEPLTSATPAVAQGEVVFMEYCQKCHPGGTAGLGPAINNKPLPGALMRFQVRNGLGTMPAFKEEVISDQELDHLVAYLKSLKSAKDKP